MTLTARAPAQRGIDLYRIEQDEDEARDSPERQLAAAVLLQAWEDASATPRTVKYSKGCGMTPEELVQDARRFLTAKAPRPWARQRRLFTGLLSLDDEVIRRKAVALFGEGH
ncbi:hypothetical protein I4970_17870 [Pseudomonas aeruginosa]|uniref:hypothetical protein n=1 Tax=Pseudomonas aeruginosa TaxID=287 RepID=UPI0018C5E08A|nr:hypothetical protein [Pseudomonas aeruginosa]EIU7092183.1 hypothetical protein [Pseudomonas aeruginosa]MBG5268043.1 hypothetical protein [Pseudomonas aeruginosa]MBR7580124.1 hypothetical protein [Pseudomonas aeruginosa]HBO2682085.1 hypothetical protein [Pseudomonas aeruginosa]HEJ6215586.1 hypothetical protein [Pseudomonas aeruginosa]